MKKYIKNMKILYNISEIESQRFNMNILKASVKNLDIRELYNEILNKNIDITFLCIGNGGGEKYTN